MARRILFFTAKAWLAFFSWTCLAFATLGGIGLVYLARFNRFLSELSVPFPTTTKSDSATTLVVRAKSHHDLMVLTSSMFESGLVGILVVTLLGTTLMIGNKTNSVRILLLFSLESLVLMMVDLVLMIKEMIETGLPPFASFQEILAYLGYMSTYYFILYLIFIRMSEIRGSVKMKREDCEKNFVAFDKKDSAKSDSTDGFATVLSVECQL